MTSLDMDLYVESMEVGLSQPRPDDDTDGDNTNCDKEDDDNEIDLYRDILMAAVVKTVSSEPFVSAFSLSPFSGPNDSETIATRPNPSPATNDVSTRVQENVALANPIPDNCEKRSMVPFQRRFMDNSHSLFVGNLTWWTTDAELETVINGLGVQDLSDIRIHDSFVNGLSKGFVDFSQLSQWRCSF